MTVVQSAQQIGSGKSPFWVFYSENYYFQLCFSLRLGSRGQLFREESDLLVVHVSKWKEVHNLYCSIFRSFSREKKIPVDWCQYSCHLLICSYNIATMFQWTSTSLLLSTVPPSSWFPWHLAILWEELQQTNDDGYSFCNMERPPWTLGSNPQGKCTHPTFREKLILILQEGHEIS